MKEEFTLQKYESGEYDVVTRDGKSARIVCTDIKGKEAEFPIIALVEENGEEYPQNYTTSGKLFNTEYVSEDDLFLVKKRWKPAEGEYFYVILQFFDVVCYTYRKRVEHCDAFYELGNCFRTKEEAEQMAEKIKQLLKNRN